MKRFFAILWISTWLFSLLSWNAPQGQAGETAALQPEPAEDLQSSQETLGRTLIAYFTLGHNTGESQAVDASTAASLMPNGEEIVGTTEYIARLIQEKTDGDLHLIQTATPYPADFEKVIEQNHDEIESGFLPELRPSALDLSTYTTIFIGYPVWAMRTPQAVLSFLAQV